MTTGVFIRVSEHRGEHLQNFFFVLIALVIKKDFVKLIPTQKLMEAWWKHSQTGTVSCSLYRQNSNWLVTLKIFACVLQVAWIYWVALKNTETVWFFSFYLLLHLTEFKWKRKHQDIVNAMDNRNNVFFIPRETYGSMAAKNSALMLLYVSSCYDLNTCFGYFTLDYILWKRQNKLTYAYKGLQEL